MEQSNLEEIGFVDVLEGATILPKRRRERLETYRSTVVEFDDGGQEPAIKVIEAESIDLHLLKPEMRGLEGHAIGAEVV